MITDSSFYLKSRWKNFLKFSVVLCFSKNGQTEAKAKPQKVSLVNL